MDNNDPRKITNKLIDLVENGQVDKHDLILVCLKWMSEADVRNMLDANEYKLGYDESDLA
tara:strand:- start:1131 stop:1310 length:180 start_codon:yes stop_codon:yes gene_type:complete